MSSDILQRSSHVPATSAAKHVVTKSTKRLGGHSKTAAPTIPRRRRAMLVLEALAENKASNLMEKGAHGAAPAESVATQR